MSIPDPSFPPVAVPPEVVVDPDALARRARDAPPPGPAAERLATAARDLATVLALAVPAAADRPAGGRSAPLAHALAEEWAATARAWADDVAEHLARLAGVAPAFVALDESSAVLDAAGTGR